EPSGLAALLGAATITETSEGSLHEGMPQPRRYTHHRAGRRARTTEIDFDWTAGEVVVRARREWRYPTRLGLLDKLAYQLALARDLAGRPPTLAYAVADAGGAKHYSLTLAGEERVVLADGAEVVAIRVEYRREDS